MEYTYNGILFGCEKNKVLIHVITWIKLENMLMKEDSHKLPAVIIFDLYEMLKIGKFITAGSL